MSCIFSFSRYQTKCVIKFLLWQLVTSRTLRLIFHQPLKQRLTGRKTGKDGNINFEYLENEKHFLDEIKNIFHSFWRAIIWWEIKIWWKIADTSFKHVRNCKHVKWETVNKISFRYLQKSVFKITITTTIINLLLMSRFFK